MSAPTTADWIWMPHWGHFICGRWCRFHLNTYLGNGYIVSTVGEYWPDRDVREIHAQVCDRQWFQEHSHVRGDAWDAAYMKRFGYEEIGIDRTYETMVFEAVPQGDPEAQCCPYQIANGQDIDLSGYGDPVAAREGHMRLCHEWSEKRALEEAA